MYFKLFLIVMILSSSVIAQNIITVLDSTEMNPIENAVVFDGTHYETTNNKGEFPVKRFMTGNYLTFSHIAYKTKKIILTKNLKIVYLKPKQLTSETVIISGKKNVLTDKKLKINLNKFSGDTYLTPAKILKQKSNLLIKEYGSFESPVTFSSRGMSSENTVVLFNEARVNDITSGIFDISKISTGSIDNINFYTTTDGFNGAYAGGVLKLESNNLSNLRKYKLSLKTDTYGLKSISANIKDYSSLLSWNINFERSYSPNHYNYFFHGKKYKRNNANFSKSFLGGSLSFKGKKYLISYYTHFSKFGNGVPGYVVTNNDNSSISNSFTQTFLNIINLDYTVSDSFNYHLTTSYNNQLQVFIDPKADLFYSDRRKESRLNDFNISNRFSYRTFYFDIKAAYNFNYTDISGVNYIKLLKRPSTNSRHFHQLNLNLTYLPSLISKNFSIVSNFSLEKINEDLGYDISGNTFSYLFCAIYEIQKYLIKIKYFKTERSPNLIERYYSNIFGPNELNPENYKGIDITLSTNKLLGFPLKASVSYFNIDGTDKIIWIPSRMGIQVPKNFSKINSKGIEVLADLNFLNWLNISTSYTYNDARNKKSWGSGDNSYNKNLIYSPKHRISNSLFITYKYINFELTHNYSSKSYFQSDNAYSSMLKSYNIFNASFSLSFNIFNRKQSISISAYNITDKEYYIIQSYPLPSRNYLFTYKLELI